MAVRGRMTQLLINSPVIRGRMTRLTLVSPVYVRGRMTSLIINPAPLYEVSFVDYQTKYSPFDLVPLTLSFLGDVPPDSVNWSRIRGFTAPGGIPSTMPKNDPRWPDAWCDALSGFPTARTPLQFLGSGVTQSFRMPGRQWEPSFYIRWEAIRAGFPDFVGEVRIDGYPHAGEYSLNGEIGYEYIAL